MPAPTQPQPVLAPQPAAGIFLVLLAHHGSEDAVRDLLGDLAGLTRSIGFRSPDGGLSCVAGVGAQLWGRLTKAPPPTGLHTFEAIHGPTHTAVSTPGDLLLHLRAHRQDLCFALAALILDRLDGHVDVVDEVHGFRYFDERDLLGFVDGTENPVDAAARAAVRIGEEDPSYAGGSYVVVQKYVHDLVGWNNLSVEEQERAVGRYKLSDVEFPEAEKPSNSHVTLNTLEDDDGRPLQIVRANMPFGTLGSREFGTYFIGYAADPAVIEQMLRNMFIGVPPGNHDRLLDFSTALTGSLYFVPTGAVLESLGEQV